MVVDPDPDEIYTKRKARVSSLPIGAAPVTSSVKYPSDGWGKSLERMPSFTRAEMNQHMANSGKRVANAEYHSIPTNLFKESENISAGRVPKGNQSQQRSEVFLFESKVLS